MQPIVNYEGYIPGRAPTPEMLYSSNQATPQYILDEESFHREREEREERRKQLEYDKLREEIRRTEIERIRRTEMEKLREELRQSETKTAETEAEAEAAIGIAIGTEFEKKRPRGRAPVGKQWNAKQGVWESESDSESE